LSPDPESKRATEIGEEIFEHLVKLAAFKLDADEAEYLRKELNGQLKAIRELEAIEVDEQVPITSHGVPYTKAIRLPLRQDAIDPCKEADDILGQAPELDGRYIVVPDIPHEELE
jgi:aspartyl-tRNA(Asn)/glutamyl-tRNA(Gln) amidotransferase subunit C